MLYDYGVDAHVYSVSGGLADDAVDVVEGLISPWDGDRLFEDYEEIAAAHGCAVELDVPLLGYRMMIEDFVRDGLLVALKMRGLRTDLVSDALGTFLAGRRRKAVTAIADALSICSAIEETIDNLDLTDPLQDLTYRCKECCIEWAHGAHVIEWSAVDSPQEAIEGVRRLALEPAPSGRALA